MEEYINKSKINKSNVESIQCTKEKNIKMAIKFLIIFISLYLILKPIYKIKDECCMCAIAKEENRYIKEFVDYYKAYDLKKIYLYENNEINGEKFDDVIEDYIKSGFVEIINFRGVPIPQNKAYNDCYRKHNKDYNWIIFYDIDEFIYLKDFKNIIKFLQDKRFEKCKRIQLNYILHTDNNIIYYDNRSLHERFTEVDPEARIKNSKAKYVFKSIIRGNLHNIHIFEPHILAGHVNACDGYGKKRAIIENTKIMMDNPDYDNYYIVHYY